MTFRAFTGAVREGSGLQGGAFLREAYLPVGLGVLERGSGRHAPAQHLREGQLRQPGQAQDGGCPAWLCVFVHLDARVVSNLELVLSCRLSTGPVFLFVVRVRIRETLFSVLNARCLVLFVKYYKCACRAHIRCSLICDDRCTFCCRIDARPEVDLRLRYRAVHQSSMAEQPGCINVFRGCSIPRASPL